MIPYEDIEISLNLSESLDSFISRVDEFRNEGGLDELEAVKLDEHFRASHIYHSSGIEGNRLTLQETAIVLRDGINISGKPLKDTIEVKNFAVAFDYMTDLAKNDRVVVESDIRSLHEHIVTSDSKISTGAYRKMGVIIYGSEHTPPEPLELSFRMKQLVDWLEFNLDKNPIIVSAVVHHELVAIHPFGDGNGRVARLLMNLILIRRGFPICNIERDDRPAYYEALSFADVGLYEPLIEMVLSGCEKLFAKYVRIREETKRTIKWAEKWGKKEAGIHQRKEAREMELWKSRIRLVSLEFQNVTELLNDELHDLDVTFYDYKKEITFNDYQQLLEKGSISNNNIFSITFINKKTKDSQRFVFRYYREHSKFSKQDKVIPLQLNYQTKEQGKYLKMADVDWADRVRIRELYFTSEGVFTVRYYNVGNNTEGTKKGGTIAEVVQWFYDDVLENVFGLKT